MFTAKDDSAEMKGILKLFDKVDNKFRHIIELVQEKSLTMDIQSDTKSLYEELKLESNRVVSRTQEVQGVNELKGDKRIDVKLTIKGLQDPTKSKPKLQHKSKHTAKVRLKTSVASKSERTKNKTIRMPTLKKTTPMKPSLPTTIMYVPSTKEPQFTSREAAFTRSR